MEKDILIFATTDLHGEMTAFSRSKQVHELKIRYPDAIWIDNGDYFIGNPLTTYYNATKEITPLVEEANHFGFDVMVPGNHDLDYGLDFLKKQVAGLDMPYVCCNLLDLNGEYIFAPYTNLESGGKKVAVIGLITQALPQISAYENTKDLICLNTKEALKQTLDQLPEVDKIIVAYHGGLEADIHTGNPLQYATGEDQAYAISQAFPEIDGLIAGHQHFTNSGIMNGAAFVQPGSHGRQVGHLVWPVDGNAEEPSVLPVEKAPVRFAAFDQWLEEIVDLQEVATFLKEYFHVTHEAVIFDLKSPTNQGLLDSFPIPYTMGRYELSSKEYEELRNEKWFSKALITPATEDRNSVVVYSNDRRMPQHRLRQNYIDNLFDEFHKWKNRG